MRQRRLLWLLLLMLVSLNILLLSNWWPLLTQPPVAYAHAFVIGSDPIDGSTVSTMPAIVRIFFDEDISPASIAHILGPDYGVVDARRSFIASGNPRELDTPVRTPGALPTGSYQVRWTALANDDGHATSGIIGFNVGRSSTGLSGQIILGPSTSNDLPKLDTQGLLAVAWEWLVGLALTLWVGILVMEGIVLAGIERPPVLAQARKQALPLQWLCLTTLLVGECINLILRSTVLTQGLGHNGIDVDTLYQLLIATNYGHLWLLRMALLVVALGLLRYTTRWQNVVPLAGSKPSVRTSRYTVAWFVLAGLILLTLAPGEDVTQLVPFHISAIVLNWLYLATQCIWFGGVAYLAYVLLRLLPIIERDHYAETLVALLRRSTPLTLGALGVFVVSGLFLSEASISNVQQLLTDPYGRALLVKLLLLASMLILGSYTLFFLRPRLIQQAILLPVVNAELPARRTRQSAFERTGRLLRRTLIVQSCLGAAALLCAALMTFFAPPIVFPALDYAALANATAPAATAQNIQTQQLGDLSVTLLVSPGRAASANTVIVTMVDGLGNPVTNASVQLTTNMVLMNMGQAHATVTAGHGSPVYAAVFARGTAFSMAGIWTIAVRITRPNQAPVQGTFQVTLG